MRILMVEDNGELVQLLTKSLARAGLDVDWARTADAAEASLRAIHYAAVVLDLGLPDADGFSVLDQMRRRRDPTPVLILSARSGLGDRVAGLGKGASDYMVKPFATEELIARLQALIRRESTAAGKVLSFGNVSLDTESRQIAIDDKPVFLPARAADVLEVLLKRRGHVVSHEQMRAQIFGGSQDIESNALEVYVYRLRRALDDGGASVHIHTIRGAGYLLDLKKNGA